MSVSLKHKPKQSSYFLSFPVYNPRRGNNVSSRTTVQNTCNTTIRKTTKPSSWCLPPNRFTFVLWNDTISFASYQSVYHIQYIIQMYYSHSKLVIPGCKSLCNISLTKFLVSQCRLLYICHPFLSSPLGLSGGRCSGLQGLAWLRAAIHLSARDCCVHYIPIFQTICD